MESSEFGHDDMFGDGGRLAERVVDDRSEEIVLKVLDILGGRHGCLIFTVGIHGQGWGSRDGGKGGDRIT